MVQKTTMTNSYWMVNTSPMVNRDVGQPFSGGLGQLQGSLLGNQLRPYLPFGFCPLLSLDHAVSHLLVRLLQETHAGVSLGSLKRAKQPSLTPLLTLLSDSLKSLKSSLYQEGSILRSGPFFLSN